MSHPKPGRPAEPEADGPQTVPSVPAPTPEAAAAPPPGEKAAGAKEPDYYDQLLRLKADFENYRKRVDREKPEWVRLGRAALLERLLPLLDALLQARAQVAKASGGPSAELAKGLELIFKEFYRLLEAEGVRPIEAAGKPYDHALHEVLGFAETDDLPEGVVTDELQRGYTLEGKVLRPARVRVAKPRAATDGQS